MNKITALFCITIYTLIIFLGSVGIVDASKKEHQFDNYGTNPENEELYINVQTIEKRTSKEENSSGHEKSVWDLYFVITKKSVYDDVTNLYVYAAASSDGNYNYTQTSSSGSIRSTYTTYTYFRNTTMSLLNSSANKFAYVETTISNDTEKITDRTPDEFYIRLTYNFKKQNSDTIEKKELTYKFKYEDVKFKEFAKYEEASEKAGVLTKEGTPFLVDFSYSPKYSNVTGTSLETKESITIDRDLFRISSFELDKAVIGTDVTVKNMNMQVYGEITNKEMIDKNFDKYVQLFNYRGSFNLNKPREAIDCQRDVYLASNYKVEKVYFNIELELSNGKTYTAKFYKQVA